jgi:hypothetical protein
MLELACKEAVFHFNKKSLEDTTIPAWTVKAKGKTFYVNHVTSNMPWSTKETPDNDATKGSIKFKDALLCIDRDNCASFRPITGADLSRLRAKERGYTRILITWKDKVLDFIKQNGIKFTPFKTIRGSCSSTFHMCDIMDPNDIVLMKLSLGANYFRILNENERMYMAYDDPSLLDEMNANEEGDMIDYEEDEED